ncbi:MAG: hypothetical protein HZB40_10480 [Rhodocyclales bacterium]|nr:hypothetical protein [Rhodocyclales bacterium]
MIPPRLLPLLAMTTLLLLLMAAALLVASHGAPALAAHIAFALGVMPLIFAAMAYFVPVLTRGPAAATAAWLPPLLALCAGGLVVAVLAMNLLAEIAGLAALLGLCGALGLAAWAMVRASRMVGRRHSGLDWYLAALAMLALALGAIALLPWLPHLRAELRLFHLHANLLGFVGLTALGTLQVLLPTCIGKPDPGLAVRMRSDVWWAGGAALLIAAGASSLLPAAVAKPVAFVGGLLYLAIVLRVLGAWIMNYRGALLSLHRAESSLLAATAGLGSLLVSGLLHGFGAMAGRPAIAGFVVAFLLPLVSGAVSQLLPVWLRPGPQGQWHATLRARLCRWSGLRGWIFLFAGVLLTVG